MPLPFIRDKKRCSEIQLFLLVRTTYSTSLLLLCTLPAQGYVDPRDDILTYRYVAIATELAHKVQYRNPAPHCVGKEATSCIRGAT